jgi:GlpG protein
MGNSSLQVVDTGRPTHWRQAPVTALFAVISIIVFLFFYLGAPQQWISYLAFMPFDVVGRQAVFFQLDGQYWRLVTPAFLHFGWLHITFNCLWLWEFGGRIERVLGSWNMLCMLLVIAAVSNVSQHLYSGPALFGGMSGVVYGLLGFSWIAPMLQPRWRLRPAPAIIAFMVGWLLLCMTGVMGILGAGAVANAAHVGGLLCGGLLGLVLGLMSRLQHRA